VIVLGLSLGLLLGSVRLARATGAPDESRATQAVRVALWAFAILIVTEAALGFCGLLGARGTLIALSAITATLAIVTSHAAPRRVGHENAREPLTPADVACLFALVAALVLRSWAGLRKTTFLYDTLSYHLHVPATWLADGRLEIVPAVFGDPSSAYAPSNLELWFAFLMAPLRSDYLSGSGQIPFAALGALAIVATVREDGGRRTAALAAALAFLLIPEIWQQARTAMTDLGMAALLLASLPFALRARRSNGDGDLATAAVALGLAVGTKYVALPLALPFAIVAARFVWRGRPRARSLAVAAALFVATGGFWYLRNAFLTGNPFYPVAGFQLPGLYDRAAMRAWPYHLPIGNIGALGEMIAAAGLGFVVLSAIVFVWRRPPLETGLLLAIVALFWLAIPYQESRFLFAGFGVAAVAMGRAAARPPAALDWRVGLLLLAGLVEYRTSERWLILPAGALGACAAFLWRRLPAQPQRWAAISGLCLAVVGVAAALTVGLERYRGGDPGYGVGTGIDDAWRWFRANVRGARVAYTGTNLAFPLTGRDLSNHVAYVNVAGAAGDRLHDFGRRAPPPGAAATPEPAPYRDGASFEVWVRNLRETHSDVLFVAALEEIVARNVRSDSDGFPIERGWADAHPALFHLRYASPEARVYGIAPP
jgi:Dolichyl-phosphate-mannose-protein mannosyltransferase